MFRASRIRCRYTATLSYTSYFRVLRKSWSPDSAFGITRRVRCLPILNHQCPVAEWKALHNHWSNWNSHGGAQKTRAVSQALVEVGNLDPKSLLDLAVLVSGPFLHELLQLNMIMIQLIQLQEWNTPNIWIILERLKVQNCTPCIGESRITSSASFFFQTLPNPLWGLTNLVMEQQTLFWHD